MRGNKMTALNWKLAYSPDKELEQFLLEHPELYHQEKHLKKLKIRQNEKSKNWRH